MEMPSLFSLAWKHAWETLSQHTALAFQRHSQSVSRDMLHGLTPLALVFWERKMASLRTKSGQPGDNG